MSYQESGDLKTIIGPIFVYVEKIGSDKITDNKSVYVGYRKKYVG